MYLLNAILKNNFLAICISQKKAKLNSLPPELVSYKILKNSLIEQISGTETTSVSLFPNRLKVLILKLRNN